MYYQQQQAKCRSAVLALLNRDKIHREQKYFVPYFKGEVGGGGGGEPKKDCFFFYCEAPLRGPNPYHFIYHF